MPCSQDRNFFHSIALPELTKKVVSVHGLSKKHKKCICSKYSFLKAEQKFKKSHWTF